MEMKFVLTSQQHQNHMILHLVDIWVEEAQEDIIHTIGVRNLEKIFIIYEIYKLISLFNILGRRSRSRDRDY